MNKTPAHFLCAPQLVSGTTTTCKPKFVHKTTKSKTTDTGWWLSVKRTGCTNCCLPVWLSVCLSVYLAVCLSIGYVRLFVRARSSIQVFLRLPKVIARKLLVVVVVGVVFVFHKQKQRAHTQRTTKTLQKYNSFFEQYPHLLFFFATNQRRRSLSSPQLLLDSVNLFSQVNLKKKFFFNFTNIFRLSVI